jgi:hypothetical protein
VILFAVDITNYLRNILKTFLEVWNDMTHSCTLCFVLNSPKIKLTKTTTYKAKKMRGRGLSVLYNINNNNAVTWWPSGGGDWSTRLQRIYIFKPSINQSNITINTNLKSLFLLFFMFFIPKKNGMSFTLECDPHVTCIQSKT